MNFSLNKLFSYDYVVEKQPIGKLLFQDFCSKTAQYERCCAFLYKVVRSVVCKQFTLPDIQEEYETSDDDGETRRALAKSISAFIAPGDDQASVNK